MRFGNVARRATLMLTAIVLVGGCASTRTAISEDDFYHSWSGEWVNTEVSGTPLYPQRFVAHADGTKDIFGFETDTVNFCTDRIELIDQWTDSDGTIWFSATRVCLSNLFLAGHEYGRITDSGNTLEFIYRGTEEPIDEWEPDSDQYNYRIYSRR